jgi:hypothetical protein
MDVVFGAIGFLLTMAFVEAILKPVVTYCAQRQVKKYVPLVLNELDNWLPYRMMNSTGNQFREYVLDVIACIAQEQGEDLSEKQLQKILEATDKTYSFLINADKFSTPPF